jgi:hypothetical protein
MPGSGLNGAVFGAQEKATRSNRRAYQREFFMTYSVGREINGAVCENAYAKSSNRKLISEKQRVSTAGKRKRAFGDYLPG